MLFNDGDSIRTTNGASYRIVKELNSGGQGVVYKIANDQATKALKVIFSDNGIAKQRFEYLASRKSPSAEFLWPEALLISSKYTGYVMPLLEEGLYSFTAATHSRHFRKISFEIRLAAAYRLVCAFEQLGLNSGLAYADINLDNLLLNSQNGDVRIIDCDNIWIQGLPHPPTVWGSERHIAPERLADRDRMPDTRSDLHSMAVAIFELLYLHHPLLGDKLLEADEQSQLHAQGPSGIYIYHSTNVSNRYTRHWHPRTASPSINGTSGFDPRIIGTPLLLDAFKRAFEDGVSNPMRRPAATLWKRALLDALNTNLRCPNHACQFKWNHVDTKSATCWWPGCNTLLVRSPVMKFTGGGRILRKVIGNGSKITPHFCKLNEEFNLNNAMAEVGVENSKWNIKNLTNESFFIEKGSEKLTLQPNSTTNLDPAMKITFGVNGMTGILCP